MSNTPKISIVIPTCNRPELVRRAISSVLEQTVQDFEIVVVDDGMIHRADSAVHSFGDTRIRYVKNETSHGGGGSRNVGIREARGTYIAFLDDDDEWKKEKLAVQVGALESAPASIALCFTGVEMIDENGEITRYVPPKEEGVVTPYERLLYRPYIWTSAIMIRASYCKDEGYVFDEKLPKNQEWDLTLRLSKEHQFFAINQTLTRLHILSEDEHMGGKGNLANIIKGNEIFLEKHKVAYERYPRSYAAQLFRLGGFNYEAGSFRPAQKLFFRAWKLQPLNMIYFTHFCSSLLGKNFYSSLRNLGK